MTILVLTRDELRAERARRSLGTFVREAWPILEPGTPFVPNWHIDAICDHLEAITKGELNRLIVNIPPRHMKSLAVTVFWPCWEWLTRPETRWLFASYGASPHGAAMESNIQAEGCSALPVLKTGWVRDSPS